MHAEIVAIGTELTSGAKLDTNSQWLSLELAEVGISVQYHLTVADDLEGMIAVLRSAINRSNIVFITSIADADVEECELYLRQYYRGVGATTTGVASTDATWFAEIDINTK